MKNFIKENYMLILIHIIVFEIIYLLLPFYWKQSDIEKSYSFLLQFSAIFSAIIITAIISKVFSQRQENFIRKGDIIKLSNKVSDLRRIARVLIQDNNLWPKNLQSLMKKKYPNLTYEIFINQNNSVANDELVSLYLKDQDINKTIGNFLLSLSSIQGNITDKGLFLYDDYDYNYTYNFNLINKWVCFNTAGSFWYTLDREYPLINEIFILDNLENESESKIRFLAKKINSQAYSDNAIPLKKLLCNIGSDFDSLYLPRLQGLLFQNLPILPKDQNYLLNSMVSIMIFGALIPIFLQSINIFNQYFIRIDIAVFFSCIIVLLFQFKKILIKELDV